MLPEKNRGFCPRCLRAPRTCYCQLLKPFYPAIQFVILIHGREAQKKIATGRLAHLCLEKSLLISGYDYTHNEKVNALLADATHRPYVLYPGDGSTNLSSLSAAERAERFADPRPLRLFVIDGTWITARKTLARSQNLWALPRLCFNPAAPSRFRVRKQPRPECFSTVEAIHQAIDLLGPSQGLAPSRPHDHLLEVFDHIVDQQIELSSGPKLYCQWSPRKKRLGAHRAQGFQA